MTGSSLVKPGRDALVTLETVVGDVGDSHDALETVVKALETSETA